MRICKWVIIVLTLMSFHSCSILGEEAVKVPAYICIPSYTFKPDTTNQGSVSEGFNDMWISRNGTLLGGIGLPSLIPIQSEGETAISIDAGINVTGQNEVRVPYPLTATFTKQVVLEPGQIDTIYPEFKYVSNARFYFIDDYDRLSRTFKFNTLYSQAGDTLRPVNDGNAWLPGRYSVKVDVPATREIVQLVTEAFQVRGAGAPVFLEIDYQSNLNLDIGYYYREPGGSVSNVMSVVQTFPTNGIWKKMYIDFSDEFSTRLAGTEYIFYIGFINIEKVVPDVYLDNIKLIGL